MASACERRDRQRQQRAAWSAMKRLTLFQGELKSSSSVLLLGEDLGQPLACS